MRDWNPLDINAPGHLADCARVADIFENQVFTAPLVKAGSATIMVPFVSDDVTKALLQTFDLFLRTFS